MSTTPQLHRASAAEQLTLDELEHEAARLNADAAPGTAAVYVADRDVILELGGPAAWFRTLERRLSNFYWCRDVRARFERRPLQ